MILKNKDIGLDNLKNVPEWLKLNVEEALPNKGLCVWIPTANFQTSSLIRVPRFPRKYSKKEKEENPTLINFEIKALKQESVLSLTAVKNEQISAQISVASDVELNDLEVSFTDIKSNKATINKDNIKVRYVQYLPVQRARSEYVWSPKIEEVIGEGVSGNNSPNVVGDALIETQKVDVPSYRAQPVWFTFKIPKNTLAGMYKGKLILKSKNNKTKTYTIEISVVDYKIPDPKEFQFHLDLWINPSSISGYYNIEDWSDEHWVFIERYLKEYASIGGKNITTTITHEPWRKPWLNDTTISQSFYGYKSMVKWIKNKQGQWKFDFTIFDKYVSLANKLGINGAINTYSLTPFHTQQKIYFYDELLEKDSAIELAIEDGAYQQMWSVFLKSFKEHLIEKNWFDKTYLGFDEKPDNVLKRLQQIIKDTAPEFLNRIVVAGHPETTKYAQNLSISYMFFPNQPLEKSAVVPVLPTIKERNLENKITTFYLCAEPNHPNSLTYSPAIESQMIPWLALKYKTDGYLRWAFNNWTSDPFKNPLFIHNQGDDYLIYPGENGPISSIRWELLKEGIENFELFKMVQHKLKLKITDTKLQEAITIATKNQDGRYKSVKDYKLAKNLLMSLIEK